MKNIENHVGELQQHITTILKELKLSVPVTEICLGINDLAYRSELSRLNNHLMLCQEILNSYSSLFPQKEKNLALFNDELLPLMNKTLPEISLELRLRYVKINKIDIPKAFKKEKVIFDIDYKSEVEAAFSKIEELFSAWQSNPIKEGYSEEEIWDIEKREFVISDRLASRIIHKNTVRASETDIDFAIGIALATEGMKLISGIIDNGCSPEFLKRGKTLSQQPSRINDLLKIIAAKIQSENEHKPSDFKINWKDLLHGRFDRTPNHLGAGLVFKSPEESKKEAGL